jgi:hypothetical protein
VVKFSGGKMKKFTCIALFFLYISSFAQVQPGWVSADSSIFILKGSGDGWTFGGGTWSPSGQTWMQSGMVNNPPENSAWAELNLSSFAGKSLYIYITWHKNGPYRPHAMLCQVSDSSGIKYSAYVDETKQANGLDLTNDVFSGWYCLGNKKVDINGSTVLYLAKDSTATPSEYMQTDGILLSEYPIIGNTSNGSSTNFANIISLSVPDSGPAGMGSHWNKQGLSEQYSETPGDTAYCQLDSLLYSDAPAGDYHVDVTWVYYNTDSANVKNVRYSVNGETTSDIINQNNAADNQDGAFTEGNSIGTWSDFYRLNGTYSYSPEHPLKVSLNYDSSYTGRLVWNLVRFVPVESPVSEVKVNPAWFSSDSSMKIILGSGDGWTFGGGTWSPSGQTWMQSGMVNNPPENSAWAQLDLGTFAGESKYIYITWHVNGPYRGHAVNYKLSDVNGDIFNVTIDESKFANGLQIWNDAFSGWYCLGNRKTDITSSTKLYISKDSSSTSSEYVQTDAVMLTDYPVFSSTALGTATNFEYMTPLSTSDAGPTGLGNHWSMPGLSEQFTITGGDSAETRLDNSVYTDVPEGNYAVDVSWVYYNVDSMNVMNARYSVNGTELPVIINQNRAADNQQGEFVPGNTNGTWSGFYRLGIYTYTTSNPVKVSAVYDDALYSGYAFVWNMIRFVPADEATTVGQLKTQMPGSYRLFQNYPNPFNPSTVIRYYLPQNSKVTLQVFDILGKEVATLVNDTQAAGQYEVNFNAKELASGIYLVQMKANDFIRCEKIMLLK